MSGVIIIWLVFQNPVTLTVWLVIFMGLIFCGLGSSDNFVGLYFCGVRTYSNYL